MKNRKDLVSFKITESKWQRLLSWNDGYGLPIVVVMQLELGKKRVRFTFKSVQSELEECDRIPGRWCADGSIYRSLEDTHFAAAMRQLLQVPITGDEAQEKGIAKRFCSTKNTISMFLRVMGPSKPKDDDTNMETVDETIGEEIPISSSNDCGDSPMFGSGL